MRYHVYSSNTVSNKGKVVNETRIPKVCVIYKNASILILSCLAMHKKKYFCQHFFCMEDCLENLQRKRNGKQLQIICPICRKECYEPKNGFPNSYVLQSLLDIHNKI